ncbi:hypothetical protein DXT76_13840 [Halobacillus trueperi]|uniref:Uncharacterized protein n=1 Tax=Halobacillus trueperi TaxID=156205 RepID=A0A3D8VM09_9BACI|nr:hypothetical protein [Halobacillus trueperi]RDY70342.1 hypothetical protein DXT76_13840 [Halobacillus trueperi]
MDIITGWVGGKIKEGMADLLAEYIAVSPLFIGVSIGVYALLNMFSKGLAKLGVAGVFIYGGALVVMLP